MVKQMFLAKWVAPETMAYAGFNYYEITFQYAVGIHLANIYHSQIPGSDQNIIIVEVNRHREDRTRTDWFFGTYRGKHSGQCKTEEEAEPFLKAVRQVPRKRNRINGRDLQEKILEIVNLEL